jgi:hypothetical protein
MSGNLALSLSIVMAVLTLNSALWLDRASGETFHQRNRVGSENALDPGSNAERDRARGIGRLSAIAAFLCAVALAASSRL